MSTTLICWCRNDSEVSDAARRYPSATAAAAVLP